MPSHNFGQYPGLSISLWFKDNADTKKYERIFAIGNGAGNGEMHIKRKDSYDHLEFTVYNSAGYSSNDRALLANKFVTGVWTHIVWTLSKRTATTAFWSIYINGVEQSFVCANSLTRYVIRSVVFDLSCRRCIYLLEFFVTRKVPGANVPKAISYSLLIRRTCNRIAGVTLKTIYPDP